MPRSEDHRLSTALSSGRWNHKAALEAIKAQATNLGRFQLQPEAKRKNQTEAQGQKKRKFQVLVNKGSGPNGSIVDRIDRWSKTSIRKLVSSSGSSSKRHKDATAQEWIGQTIHYGVFDPAVMIMSSDEEIIRRCKNCLEVVVEKGTIQVPEPIRDREKKLRTVDVTENTTKLGSLTPNWLHANSGAAHDASDIETSTSSNELFPVTTSNVARVANGRRNMSSLDRDSAASEGTENEDVVDSIEQEGSRELLRDGQS